MEPTHDLKFMIGGKDRSVTRLRSLGKGIYISIYPLLSMHVWSLLLLKENYTWPFGEHFDNFINFSS